MERVLGLSGPVVICRRIGRQTTTGAVRTRRVDGALGPRGADRAGRRGARAAGVEPGERVERAARRSWRGATRSPPGSTPTRTRRRGAAGAGPRLARLRPARADRRRRRDASGPRCRSCSGSAAPSCAARSTCWSSARARRRWSSTTRPTASTAPSPGRARRPLRDPAHDLRAAPSPRRCGAAEVEVAYVFLERPEEPALTMLGAAEMEAGPRAPGSGDRPHRRRRVPCRPAGAARLGPLPRLPAWSARARL